MAYYFMVKEKKGKYKPLDISSSIYYQTTNPKYKKPYAFALDEIDSYTMMFNDESELRNALVAEGILPVGLSKKPLSIRFLNKDEYNKVMYDFLYQRDIEYIACPDKVVELILRRYYQNDFAFLAKLASNFSKYRECSTTAPEVARLAEASIRSGYRNPALEELDSNEDTMVARLVKLLILKHTEKPDGKIEYKDEVNYRNLHSVIAFINNYNEKLKSKLEGQTIIDEVPFLYTEAPKFIIPEKPKSRKRSKRTEIEGQLTFQDLM